MKDNDTKIHFINYMYYPCINLSQNKHNQGLANP